jgi:predicted secreted protein
MPSRSYAHLPRALPDARSGRVVLLSHCLLNQNTRYPGGAVCPGVVTAAVERYVQDGTGIVQMPCPEQRVWGGVLKRRLLWVLSHRWVARPGPVLVRLATPYLRRRYARLARSVADDIEDYLASGFTVTSIIGVGGSPSCGVHTTLDLPAALTAIARRPRAPVTAAWLNETVVDPALRPGRGLFIQALTDELGRRRLTVPVAEQTLTRPASTFAPAPPSSPG